MSDDREEGGTPETPPEEAASEAPEKRSHHRRVIKPGAIEARIRASKRSRRIATAKRAEIGEILADPALMAAKFGLDPELRDMFSDSELVQMWREAEFQVEAEKRAVVKKELKESMVRRAKASRGLASKDDAAREHMRRIREKVMVFIDLAEFADRIHLDGTPYMHGRTYEVSRGVAETLIEIAANTRRLQAELDGKRRNYYDQHARSWAMHGGGHAQGRQIWGIG